MSVMEQNESISLLIQDNSKDIFLETSNLLLQCCDDILLNPSTSNYRVIRVGSDLIQEKLLPVSGALQCLFSLGYEEGDEHFYLPENANLEAIRRFRNKLTTAREKCLDEYQKKSTNANIEIKKSRKIETPSLSLASNQQKNKYVSEENFFQRIKSHIELVLLYEDKSIQQEALKEIPSGELNDKAKEKYAMLKKQQGLSVSIQDCFLVELLFWFKFHFFSWIDTLKCERCGDTTAHDGAFQPTNDELKWLASRVEKHICKKCQIAYRFPRYSHPKMLLKTRKGRCGEWANCFTLLCRALGYEARLVVDWSDHVWTEVYSMSHARWIHCDPCENCCDKPLVYECGWGKKLTYAIAFSKDEIQDVTWRYTTSHADVLQRRTLCHESWLLQKILSFTDKLQMNLSRQRKEELLHRKIKELVEFLMSREAKSEELTGRLSGSLDWRIARSEIGNVKTKGNYVFTLKKSQLGVKYFQVKYSAALDKYVIDYNENKEISGWQNCIYEEHNMFYKKEHDWKMVYLARTKDSLDARICWKFDFSKANLVVKNILLQISSTCFENASIQVEIITVNGNIPLSTGTTSIPDLGVPAFSLQCHLSGGNGDNAWQHAQLFRQGLDDPSFPFDMKIELE